MADEAVVLDAAATVHGHRTICRVAAVAVKTFTTVNGIRIVKLMTNSRLKPSHCCFAVGHKKAPHRNRKPAILAQMSAPVLYYKHDDLPLLPVPPLSALFDAWSQKEAAKIAAIRKKRTRRTAAGKMNRKQRIQTKTLPSRPKGSRVFRPSDMMTCTFSASVGHMLRNLRFYHRGTWSRVLHNR